MIGKQDAIFNTVQHQFHPIIIILQHDTSYYQPQTIVNYNHLQQHHHHKTTQQATYRIYYGIVKVDKCGVTQSGIPSPDTKTLPIITLIYAPKYIIKYPTVSSHTSLKTETSKIPQLKTHTKLQSKYREWVST